MPGVGHREPATADDRRRRRAAHPHGDRPGRRRQHRHARRRDDHGRQYSAGQPLQRDDHGRQRADDGATAGQWAGRRRGGGGGRRERLPLAAALSVPVAAASALSARRPGARAWTRVSVRRSLDVPDRRPAAVGTARHRDRGAQPRARQGRGEAAPEGAPRRPHQRAAGVPQLARARLPRPRDRRHRCAGADPDPGRPPEPRARRAGRSRHRRRRHRAELPRSWRWRTWQGSPASLAAPGTTSSTSARA